MKTSEENSEGYKKNQNNLEKNKSKISIGIILGTFCIGAVILEIAMRAFLGLGSPVIVDSSPVYGFRPLPNASYRRILGAKIHFNNLSLRTEQEWNGEKADKILFLGDSVTYGGAAVDDTDLFSYLATQDIDGYQGGNAGVNAWGVENIHGLIVEHEFTPAKIYVTTLIEEDFYRGLTRLQGLPFHNIKPKFAWHELWQNFCVRQSNKQYRPWMEYADDEEKRFVVEKAIRKLRAMEQYLREKGYRHILFISPEKKQVLHSAGKDELVRSLLEKYELSPIYIIDELNKLNLADQQKKEIFKDEVHLERKGHEIWARIIGKELKNVIEIKNRDNS